MTTSVLVVVGGESEPALVEIFLNNLDRWSRGASLRNVVDKRLGFVP